MSRRLTVLSTLVGLATAIVAIAILVSSGGADPQRHAPSKRDVTSIVRGVPQHGLILGDPRANVLLVEFADPQCPYCRELAVNTWPQIIKRYVRTGKVRVELRLVDFLGKDSTRAARALEAAGLQNKMWDAAARFFDAQGRENTGYVTDQFLREVLGGVHGLDVDQVMVDRAGPQVREALGEVKTMQSRYGVHATPTLLIGSDDADLHQFADGVVSVQRLGQALDAELLKTI
jgi:protein-disulfide isomerase